ncbi:MAG: DUF2007 domain-containing protein [Deltaproteobacteria bacterium]|nr:MAG: DUF2007 domain-containing protein [Deltaproteobacteria bacterium]
MRVCLQCDSEYIDDPPLCRSCGAETVTPEEAEVQRQLRERLATEKLVSVYTFDSPVDEAILSRLMTEAEIPWTVKGGPDGAFPGVSGGAPPWGELLVPEDSVEAARRVVARYEKATVEDHSLDGGLGDEPAEGGSPAASGVDPEHGEG